MDKGILNSNSLENNIKKINFYTEEEKNKIEKIITLLKKCCVAYQSSNDVLFSENIDYLKLCAEKNYEKRIKYSNTLKKVIIQYKMLSEQTKRNFENR